MNDIYVFSLYTRAIKHRNAIGCILLLRRCDWLHALVAMMRLVAFSCCDWLHSLVAMM